MYCSHCGQELADTDRFCSQCGAQTTASSTGHPDVAPQDFNYAKNGPERPKQRGCVAQAFHDMTKIPGVFKRVCQIGFLPALIAIVGVVAIFIPVIGGLLAAICFVAAYVAYVCGTGYAIEWGRDLSHQKSGFSIDMPLMRPGTFALGFFGKIFQDLLGLIAALPLIGALLSVLGTAISSLGASIMWGYADDAIENLILSSLGLFLLAAVATVVLAIFLGMFADAAVMHFAVTGRMESAFSLKSVWKAYKANLGKLFCASVCPTLIVGVVKAVLEWIVSIIFGVFAAASLAQYYGYYGYGASYQPSGIAAILSSGGLVLIVFLVCMVFVGVVLDVFATMFNYRAMGYWAARYAGDWADEDVSDKPFIKLPGEQEVATVAEDEASVDAEGADVAADETVSAGAASTPESSSVVSAAEATGAEVVEDASTDDATIEDAPAEDMPAGNAPADGAPAEGAPVNDASDEVVEASRTVDASTENDTESTE